MSTRKLIFFLCCCSVLAALGGYWMFGKGPASKNSGIQPADHSAQSAVLEVDTLQDAHLALAKDSGELERVDLTAEQERELEQGLEADRQWITGQVIFAFPIPAQEELYVMSLDGPFNERQLYGPNAIADGVWDKQVERKALHDSAPVQPDGSFRISLPASASQAHLALSGRYIYSRSSRSFNLHDSTQEIQLGGQLGSWIRGLLSVPVQMQAQIDLAEVEMKLGPDVSGDFNAGEIRQVAYASSTNCAASGLFEFRAVSDSFVRGLVASHSELATRLVRGLKPKPGELLELEVDLESGATLHGVVLDESQAPLLGAPVSVSIPGPAGQPFGVLRETTTLEGGAFTLNNVPSGEKLEISAKPDGYLPGRKRLEDSLRDQQVVSNLVLEVSAGASVAGRVVFPDGTLAEGAEVQLGVDFAKVEPAMIGRAATLGLNPKVKTQADGRFTIRGLPAGPFRLVAKLDMEAGDHPGHWRARETDVSADTQGLELVLGGVTALRGRVETPAELPIENFVVSLTLKGSGGTMGIGAVRKQETVEAPGPEGEFEAGEFAPGLWAVTLSAEGFAATSPQEIELPQAAGIELPNFLLLPAAQVAGTVLDAAGAPVAGAKVTLEQGLGERIEAQLGVSAPEALSDHEGKFLLEGVDPGSRSLVASLTGFASSKPLALEVGSGQLIEDVQLTLRTGGSIAGEVLDESGPVVGRMVIVQDVPSYSVQHIMQSGSDGGFRVEHLEPGSWQVISMPNVMTGEIDAEAAEGIGDMLNGMELDIVDVVDGQESWVSLGKPAENPVEVMGSVTQGGEGIAHAIVVFVPENGEGLGDMKMCSTNAQGDFRQTLDKRGAYLVTVQANVSTGRQNSIEFQAQIPEDVSSYRLPLTLPGGGISGRVLAANGEPAAACRVTLNVDGGIAYGSFLGGHYTEMVTDKDGRFKIEHLSAGSYTVAAGGATLSGLLGDDSVGGRVLKDGLRLTDGQWLSDVDFRLKRPGKLTGTVRGIDGAPVSGATVFVRDSQGRLLERFSMVSTNGAGQFTYLGVSEGDYRVVAKKEGLVSQLSAAVHLREAGSARCDVQLDAGALMLVSVADRNGADIRARITVKDDKGNEMTGMLSTREIMENFGRGFSTKEQAVGPLPPGKYRVEAFLDDGRKTRKNITLSGSRDRKVKLRVN